MKRILFLAAAVAAFSSPAFAQQIVVPVQALMPMPPGMDFDTAAAITLTYGTSHHALIDRAALKPGETVLVPAPVYMPLLFLPAEMHRRVQQVA